MLRSVILRLVFQKAGLGIMDPNLTCVSERVFLGLLTVQLSWVKGGLCVSYITTPFCFLLSLGSGSGHFCSSASAWAVPTEA